MKHDSLDEELLKAIRRAPNHKSDELAELIGLPRTNFGRPLGHRLQHPLQQLCDQGLIEEQRGRYRLTEQGRQVLAARASGDGVG